MEHIGNVRDTVGAIIPANEYKRIPVRQCFQKIIDDAVGPLIEHKIPHICEVDRRKAIKMTLDMLQYNDILVLCGKGHEDYQVLNGITVYLDEHEIVKKFMDKYKGN